VPCVECVMCAFSDDVSVKLLFVLYVGCWHVRRKNGETYVESMCNGCGVYIYCAAGSHTLERVTR
jgi:hypothetical protein